MNPFNELLRKIGSSEQLSRSEAVQVGRLGLEKLALYAQAYDALSQVYPTRTARREARDQWAQTLGITPRAINMVIRPDFKRPKRIRDLQSQYLESAQHELVIFKAALSVIAKNETIDTAADKANCSTRTVYRETQQLLAEFSLSIRDLQNMSLTLREQLAWDIQSKHLPKLEAKVEKRFQQTKKDREIRKKKSTNESPLLP